MGTLGSYPDDTVTTDDDKFATYASDGTLRLTPASNVRQYVVVDNPVEPSERTGGYATGPITVTSTGVKTITAPGFMPKGLRIFGVVTTNDAIQSSSTATFDGTTLRCMATSGSGTAGFSRYYSVFGIINTAPAQVATITSFTFTATGFTCNVTTSSPDVTVWYEAIA